MIRLSRSHIKTIVAFPGQGQLMPKGFLETIEQTEDISQFKHNLTHSLSSEFTNALFDSENHKEYFSRTSNLQPAIVSSSLLLLDLLNKRLPQPLQADYIMGHSLGELTALLANEVWDPKLGPLIARKRGELMESIIDVNRSYGLVALMFGKPEELEIIESVTGRYEYVAIANKNVATQVVLSGPKDELSKAVDEIKSLIRVKPIELSAQVPFHNGLLQNAADQFQKYIETNYPVNRSMVLDVPIVSNLTGKTVTTHGEAVDNFVKGFYKPVLFHDSIATALNQGDQFQIISFGPNAKVNQSFFKKTDTKKQIRRNICLESPEDINSFVSTLG